MIKRLLWMVTLVLLVSSTFAQAQQPKKVPRIGYLAVPLPIPALMRSGRVCASLDT